jgi:sortase (surface protein transpeptidase)
MPGQNRLVYIAGHRTTYLAPFSPRHELLRLQACHPRSFATHRYIVDARLVSVRPRGGEPYSVGSPTTKLSRLPQ